MENKKRTVLYLSVLVLLIAVAFILNFSGTPEKTDTPTQEASVEQTDWIISPEEITVDVGEKFQIQYSPITDERPLLCFQPEGDNISFKSDIIAWAGGTWDPLKGIQRTDKPGYETYEAISVGTTYITVQCGVHETANKCKVTVIEKQTEEATPTADTKPDDTISVVLKKELPQDVHFCDNGGRVYSTCTIRTADINITDEKITVNLLCEKTFDTNKNASTYCFMNWKLYDSSDVVVKSGSISKQNIDLDEKFSETLYIANIDSLKPGVYTLAFTDMIL